MPSRSLSAVVQHLRTAAGRGGGGRTDGELLTQFLNRRDEDALAALVERHAPMVWGVCRRVLRNPHDAEDAFQATFLVLVQKAATVVPRDMVANWLHGVAQQTAVRLRASAAKRGWRETQMDVMPEPAVAEARDEELLSRLDEELKRLPERCRTLIVLCDLEGRTRKEVARQLGCPEGTVASGLVRARELLAKRLTRRGLAVSGGSLAATLSHSVASADVPASVVTSTINVATLLAAGKAAGVISVPVAESSDGIIRGMFMSKLKVAIAVVMVALVVGGGGTSMVLGTAAAWEDDQTLTIGHPVGRTAHGRDDQKPVAAKPPGGKPLPPKDLLSIEPPGGVPLSLVVPGTNEFDLDRLKQVSDRLRSVPEEDLEKWVVELERVTDIKLKDGLPSPRQACRTDLAVRLSVAFDGLKWHSKVADNLYGRARTVQQTEAKLWKEAFESVLKQKIGIEQAEQGRFSNLAGGPPWAVPLVLIPVDALYEGQKYSVERGKKYRTRLNQLTKDDVALWREKVDKFNGTSLDAAVNIILIDEFFRNEEFQRDTFKTTVEQRDGNKPEAEKNVKPEKAVEKEAMTAWGKEVGGVQAGLGFMAGEQRAYTHGEVVTLVLRVRNVGKEEVKFSHYEQEFRESALRVTHDDGGKAVPLQGVAWTWTGRAKRNDVTLAPGKTVDLSEAKLALRPVGDKGQETTAWTLFGTGKYQLQCEKAGGSIWDQSGPDPILSKLATGKLELEVREAPAEKPKVITPEEAVKIAGDSELRKKFNATKPAVEFKVEFVTKAIQVMASGEKDAAWAHGHSPDDVCLGLLVPNTPGAAIDLVKRDHIRFVATLTAKVIGQLNKVGITDLEKHFKGKTVRVTGPISRHAYDGFGSPDEVEIVLDDMSQLEVVK